MSAPSVLEQAGLVARLDLVRRLRDRSVLIQVFLAPVFLALIFGGGAGGIQAEIWLADADEAGAVAVIPTRFGEAVESGARAELVVVRDAGDDVVAGIATNVARSIAHQARSHRVTVATTLSAAGQLGVPMEPGEVAAVVLLRRSLAR
jgi:hypothetical protein